MIVGWRVASHMKTDMVLDALEMARWRRDTTLEGLISHTDAGSQFTSIRYGEKLADLGAVPSIGSVGDAFDNALAESVNAAYKSELIRGPGHGPSKTWNWPPLAGCTGTTPSASTSISATLRRQSSRRSMPPRKPARNWLESYSRSLHQTQDGSLPTISISFAPIFDPLSGRDPRGSDRFSGGAVDGGPGSGLMRTRRTTLTWTLKPPVQEERDACPISAELWPINARRATLGTKHRRPRRITGISPLATSSYANAREIPSSSPASGTV